MGGKRSSGTSTTTPTIPPWLQGIIQPLLAGTAGKMTTLQNQGWNVLQGNPELNSPVTLEDIANINTQNAATSTQRAQADAAPDASYGRSPYQR